MKRRSHKLWSATSDEKGNIVLHRTTAERDDLESFEYLKPVVATSLGLWGSYLVDSSVFYGIPSDIVSGYQLTAFKLRHAGAPRVLSWRELYNGFGEKKVKEATKYILLGMKARRTSKDLNIPWITAADVQEHVDVVGKKVVASIIRDFKGGRPNKARRQYGKIAEEIESAMKLPTKISVDKTTKDYWEKYFGPYGEQMTKELKKRIKADLHNVWLKKSGLDDYSADYWSKIYATSFDKIAAPSIGQGLKNMWNRSWDRTKDRQKQRTDKFKNWFNDTAVGRGVQDIRDAWNYQRPGEQGTYELDPSGEELQLDDTYPMQYGQQPDWENMQTYQDMYDVQNQPPPAQPDLDTELGYAQTNVRPEEFFQGEQFLSGYDDYDYGNYGAETDAQYGSVDEYRQYIMEMTGLSETDVSSMTDEVVDFFLNTFGDPGVENVQEPVAEPEQVQYAETAQTAQPLDQDRQTLMNLTGYDADYVNSLSDDQVQGMLSISARRKRRR